MRKLITPFLTLALFGLSHANLAGAVDFDSSFGDDGYVEAPGTAEWIGDIPNPGPRLANYPGQRLVVGGHSETGFAVYRYLADGRADRGFGERGVALITLPGEHGEDERGAFGSVSAIAVQPDGKILVAGLYTPYPVNNCEECEPEYGDPREYSAIVRLDPDGGLDTRFGGSRRGHRNEGLVFLHSRSINQIAVHGGRILIAGEEVQGSNEFGEAGYVKALRLDGRRDRHFNGHRGIVRLPPSKWENENSASSVAAIRFDASGRIYAGGFDRGSFMLARLTSGGRIDRGFGRHGFVRTEVGSRRCRCSWGQGLARDRQGRLLVSGVAGLAGHRDAFAVARYTRSGRLDQTFGRGGIVRTRVGRNSYGDGIVVQPDGRIVVVGSTDHRHLFLGLFTVVRYLPDGRRDRGFFGDGVFTARLLKYGERAVQPLLDRAGRLLVAGETIVARFPRGS